MSKMRMSQPGGMDPGKSLFESNDNINVLDFLGSLRRRKWLVAGVTIAGTLLAIVAGQSIQPLYTATASILIAPEDSGIGGRELPPDQETIANQIRKMQSRTFHSRVMEDMGLFEDAEFNPALREEVALVDRFPLSLAKEPLLGITDQLPASVNETLGLNSDSDIVPDADAVMLSRQYALRNFKNGLQLANDGVSHVINVGFVASTSRKAALIANRVSEVYVSELLEEEASGSDSDAVWLQRRLAELEVELEQAERAVVDYQSRTGGASVQAGNQQQFEVLNRQLLDARAQLSAKQSQLAQIRQAQAGGTAIEIVIPSAILVSLRNQEITLLREEAEARQLYGPNHPRMIELRNEVAEIQRKIGAEVNGEIRRLEGEVSVAASTVGQIESQLSNLQTQSIGISQAEVALGELQRQRDIIRAQYEELLTQLRVVQDRRSTVTPDARIIAWAEPPPSPSTPGTKIFAAAGLVLSFCLGSIGAIMLDRMDRGIRSSREVERILGLNTLGLVPKLERLKRTQKPYQYLMEKPLSAYAEAIRGVYMAVKLSNVDKQPKVILVTSSLPQEGKTTLAVSLATFAARSHKRVLIIDLDLRHPSVHREMGWQVSGGLVEFMANERSLEEVIHHDLETGLHFLPIKGQTTNPTDLLDSQRMRLLIEHCRENYDYVVIDSAPLASVTDTRVAALLADRLIFCVRWGETVESAAIDSVQSLRDVGVEPAGGVITQVDMKRHALYGYGDVGEYYNRSQKYYVN